MSPPREQRRRARTAWLGRALTLALAASLWPLAVDAQAAPAPTIISPPTISGVAQQGQTLTEQHGSWTGNPTSFTYRWLRCDPDGTHCTAIDNATDQTYVVASTDVGHRIAVRERATNTSGQSAPATSAPTAVVVPSPEVSTSPPTISGTAEAGQTLTENPATWSIPPTSVSYQWSRCDGSGNGCAAIAGATGQAYTLTAVDAGHTIVVQEQATVAGGQVGKAMSSPTAVVVITTSTGLLVAPAAPVANQQISLIAVITAAAGGASPSGTVTFTNGGTPVEGCINKPVAQLGQAATASCELSLAASTAKFSAAFTRSAGSFLTPSASQASTVTVGRDSTSTTLDVSKTTQVGQSTTYTATVAPPVSRPGPLEPSGRVDFLDGGQPIAACTGQPLVRGGATCSITYRQPGSHSIKAVYQGDKNFTSSSSASQSTQVVSPTPTVRGTITATMQWTFHYTRSYTSVSALVVNGALHTTVSVECHGKGCPFTKQSTTVNSTRPCHQGTKRTCPTHGTLDLTQRFHNRRLSVGAWFTVTIARSGWIGKVYRFTIQSAKAPRARLACLAPGKTRPGVGC